MIKVKQKLPAGLKKNSLSVVLAGLQSCYAFQPMMPLGWRGSE